MTNAADAKAQAKLLPDDILDALLVLAQRKHGAQRLTFRGHDSDLQSIFSDLSRTYALLSQYFVFSNTGPAPFSPALNESISRLQLSGFIGRENPDYEQVFLRPAAYEYFDHVLSKRLDERTLGALKEAAEAFLKKVPIG